MRLRGGISLANQCTPYSWQCLIDDGYLHFASYLLAYAYLVLYYWQLAVIIEDTAIIQIINWTIFLVSHDLLFISLPRDDSVDNKYYCHKPHRSNAGQW